MAAEVVYTTEPQGVRAADLDGFFVGWPVQPSPERHLEILRGATTSSSRAREGASSGS